VEVRGPLHYHSVRTLQPVCGIVDGASGTGCSTTLWIARSSLTGRALRTRTGDYPNNWERFGLFCRAVLEAAKLLGVPQVFSCTRLAGGADSCVPADGVLPGPGAARGGSGADHSQRRLSGVVSADTTERLLFPWEIFTMDKLEQFDNFNFLKGGLVYSDMLTTVSRKYAEEIQTAEFGEKLDGVLRGRAADLRVF